MVPRDRLRRLLDLRHFISDWGLACCFHLARQARWGLTADHTLACMRHPRGFVREAVVSYLRMASPRAMVKLLPMLKDDPDRLVADQVKQIVKDFAENSSINANHPLNPGNNGVNFSNTPGLETI
jgi:hypothetical protein